MSIIYFMNVIAVDLDNTLIQNGIKTEVVDFINKKFEDPNNFIVIYTARSYEIFHETRDLLIKNKIKHHALVMEKMRADLYIDDKAINPWDKGALK